MYAVPCGWKRAHACAALHLHLHLQLPRACSKPSGTHGMGCSHGTFLCCRCCRLADKQRQRRRQRQGKAGQCGAVMCSAVQRHAVAYIHMPCGAVVAARHEASLRPPPAPPPPPTALLSARVTTHAAGAGGPYPEAGDAHGQLDDAKQHKGSGHRGANGLEGEEQGEVKEAKVGRWAGAAGRGGPVPMRGRRAGQQGGGNGMANRHWKVHYA